MIFEKLTFFTEARTINHIIENWNLFKHLEIYMLIDASD